MSINLEGKKVFTNWCNKINEAEEEENKLTIRITGRTIPCSPHVERKVSDDMEQGKC